MKLFKKLIDSLKNPSEEVIAGISALCIALLLIFLLLINSGCKTLATLQKNSAEVTIEADNIGAEKVNEVTREVLDHIKRL